MAACCIALTQDITPINPEMQNLHWSFGGSGYRKRKMLLCACRHGNLLLCKGPVVTESRISKTQWYAQKNLKHSHLRSLMESLWRWLANPVSVGLLSAWPWHESQCNSIRQRDGTLQLPHQPDCHLSLTSSWNKIKYTSFFWLPTALCPALCPTARMLY